MYQYCLQSCVSPIVGIISLFHSSPSDGLKYIIVSHCISLNFLSILMTLSIFLHISLAFYQAFVIYMDQVFCLFFFWDSLFLNKHNIPLYTRIVLSFCLLEIFHCFVFCHVLFLHCSLDFICCSSGDKVHTSESLQATSDVFLCESQQYLE